MKAKDLTKQACKNAIKRCDEKQRETKEYWDKKMEEVKIGNRHFSNVGNKRK